ncbi:ABC transporter permease [Tenggerimyces flavus]|uniref:ABC transporter permease n=1 Tax=Tenggerimyces flavus TaxID=1708749 RepID=A0ABV7YQN0_9ACTN|nr:ABC transporter permease [Tenggerimyces flavus]MBM7790128.1 peptide/nickel transport system permease protein [Tenggerimyces flavus]
MTWLALLGRRLAAGALTLPVLSLVIFVATEVLPGDAAGVIAGPAATAEQRDRVRAELELDRPAVERYADWLGGALRGDLGSAYVGGRPVAEIIIERMPSSVLLAGLVYAVVLPLGALLGAVAGLGSISRRRLPRFADRVISACAVGGVAVPEFLTATLLLVVLAIVLGVVPRVSLVPVGASPLDVPEVLVLPTATLAIVLSAFAVRLLRAAVADAAGSPYIEAARLNGIRGVRLVVAHVLPNAAGPAVQALGAAGGYIVGAAIVAETVFSYPGIGTELVRAVSVHDLPLVQGIALTLAAVALLALLVGDLVALLIDPRSSRA